MDAAPLFSIVTPVYNPPAEILHSTINSVRRQRFKDWELILVDDCSTAPHVVEVLREAASSDPRIRVIERETNGHIVAASNDGIAAANGEFIALLDHDDLLLPRALRVMREAIGACPEADYLYSDEWIVDADGDRLGEFHKPPWSPERLRGQMYTGHLSVLRTSVVRDVGGFREGFDGSQDHDLVLRVTERARKVVHIPDVLYHWRGAEGSTVEDPTSKPYAWEAGRRAVQEHLDRSGISARARLGSARGTYVVDRDLDPDLLVSVVIPTRGSEGLVWGERRTFVVEAVRSVVELGGHPQLEFVVVHDAVTPDSVLDALREAAGVAPIRLIPYEKEFNFSEKCNVGAMASHGEVVVLLNDDIEVATPGFINNLVAPLFEDGVGLTGARLLFSDSTIQHAGVAIFEGGPGHMFYKHEGDWSGPFNVLAVSRECSGLTGACIAVKRHLFEEVGGLSEQFPLSYNDVDFSFKIASAGYRQVLVSNATAYHFESKSRDPKVKPWERRLLRERWTSPKRDLYVPTYGVPHTSSPPKPGRPPMTACERNGTLASEPLTP